MVLKKNYIYIIIAFLIGGSIVCVFLNNVLKEDKKKNVDYISRFDALDSEFAKQGLTVLNVTSNLYVGNNLKELKNGYYDAMYSVENEKVCLKINKIWSEIINEEQVYFDLMLKQYMYLISGDNIFLENEKLKECKEFFHIAKDIHSVNCEFGKICIQNYDIVVKCENKNLVLEVENETNL